MTPQETKMVIEASSWNFDQDQKQLAWLAWHVAALSRSKRLPALNRLLSKGESKKLSGKELQDRREEFKKLKERVHAKIPTR